MNPAAENSYVFDIDCLQTMKGLDGREVQSVFVVFLTKIKSIYASFMCSFIPLEAKYFHLLQSRLRDVSLPHHIRKIVEESPESVPFCIDAAHTGTVARFINHSCQPNLFVQCVLSDHHDITLARVMLFAADNIPPLKVCFPNLISFVL